MRLTRAVAGLAILCTTLEAAAVGAAMPGPPNADSRFQDSGPGKGVRIQASPLLDRLFQRRALLEQKSDEMEFTYCRDKNKLSDRLRDSFLDELMRIDNALHDICHRLREYDGEVAMDYVRFLSLASPRLDGHVVRVGPNRRHQTLEDAAPDIRPGTTVLLGSGKYVIPEHRDFLWRDVAVVGESADSTELSGTIFGGNRLRIQSLHYSCEPGSMIFTRGRRGDSFHLKDCLISHYKGNPHGWTAIHGHDTTMLVEDCLFDGMRCDPRRSFSRPPAGGTAFNLRNEVLLYVRRTRFVDNRQVSTAVHDLSVFDQCSGTTTRRLSNWHFLGGGVLFLRKNKLEAPRTHARVTNFSVSSDDEAFVRSLALGRRDESVAAALDTLGPFLRTSLDYWSGLLRHPDEATRDLARARIHELMDVEIPRAELAALAGVDERICAHELEASWLQNRLDELRSTVHRDDSARRLVRER